MPRIIAPGLAFLLWKTCQEIMQYFKWQQFTWQTMSRITWIICFVWLLILAYVNMEYICAYLSPDVKYTTSHILPPNHLRAYIQLHNQILKLEQSWLYCFKDSCKLQSQLLKLPVNSPHAKCVKTFNTLYRLQILLFAIQELQCVKARPNITLCTHTPRTSQKQLI